MVVWVNEFFGRVEEQGKRFSEMTAFLESQDKICGLVVIPKKCNSQNWNTGGQPATGCSITTDADLIRI
jgi:hypothetical protein